MTKTATPKGVVDKVKTDWESIEKHYRANVLSIREVAKMHDITDTAIRKEAKKRGWVRDLTDKVNALVRSELVRTEVRTGTTHATEREIVDAAATAVVKVVTGHRKRIGRTTELMDNLLAELEGQTSYAADLEELGELLRSEDDRGQDKRNDLYKKIIAGANRIDSFKKLTDAMKNVIFLERQAFNISTVVEDEAKSESATATATNYNLLREKIKGAP